MRIITGKLKGRKINIPKGLEVRPTTDRTKESLFNVIEARTYIEDATILDLFGGSGNLGFEAVSRGAKHVTYVELDSRNAKNIEKIAEQLEIDSQVRVINMDVSLFLETKVNSYDFIFCDPPYDFPTMHELTEKVLSENWLKEDGWFILEHDKRHKFKEHPHCFFSKAYGRTTVSIFKKEID